MWGRRWRSVVGSSSQFSVGEHVKHCLRHGAQARAIFSPRPKPSTSKCSRLCSPCVADYGLTRTVFRMQGVPELGIALQNALKKFGRLGNES